MTGDDLIHPLCRTCREGGTQRKMVALQFGKISTRSSLGVGSLTVVEKINFETFGGVCHHPCYAANQALWSQTTKTDENIPQTRTIHRERANWTLKCHANVLESGDDHYISSEQTRQIAGPKENDRNKTERRNEKKIKRTRHDSLVGL